jgi:hypothetical protein
MRYRGPVRPALAVAVLILAVVLAVVVGLAGGESVGPPDMLREDLPATRISHPDLLAALRAVRRAFEGQGGGADGGTRTRLTVGEEFESLEGIDVGRLREVVREVELTLNGSARDPVWSVNVRLDDPRVFVHGRDPQALEAVARSVQAAFAPHARAWLAHPRPGRFALLIVWILVQVVGTTVVARRTERRATAWSALVGPLPALAFMSLQLPWADLVLPGVIAHASDASWWARYAGDVLHLALGTVVTAILVVGLRLDLRARRRRMANEDPSPAFE